MELRDIEILYIALSNHDMLQDGTSLDNFKAVALDVLPPGEPDNRRPKDER